MERREEPRLDGAEWVVCLRAVAEMVEGLPLLYRVVEAADDDVRIELLIKGSAREVLRLGPVDQDHVAIAVSRQLVNTRALRARTAQGIAALDDDLQWAASRPCADQARELLSALVRFRGTILSGSNR
jgi:hypothetical protein